MKGVLGSIVRSASYSFPGSSDGFCCSHCSMSVHTVLVAGMYTPNLKGVFTTPKKFSLLPLCGKRFLAEVPLFLLVLDLLLLHLFLMLVLGM